MNYNKILRKNGKNISVVYTRMYETVAKMVLKYYDTSEYSKVLFVVNVLTDSQSNNIDFRGNCPGGSKYIYYQLQNLFLYPENVAHEYMDQFDEIWDCSHENLKYYPEDVKEKAKFMPLRYVDIPKIEPKENYKYDLGFIGTLTPFRQETLSRISKYWTNDSCSVKIITGIPYQDLYDEIADCKYLIDIPRSSNSNHFIGYTRIFEAICSGKQVIVELQDYTENLYGELLKGYSRIYEVIDLVKNPPLSNPWSYFKNWTENNESYEQYRNHFNK